MKTNVSTLLIGVCFVFVLFFYLTGCMHKIQIKPAPSITNNPPQPTTALISPTRIIPTLTPRPSQTNSPTNTATSTPSPLSPTPLPTLSAEEAKSLAFNMLQTNGSCKLPCLWGFSPGNGSIKSLSQFLASFGNQSMNEIYTLFRIDSDGGILFFSFPIGRRSYEFFLEYYQNNNLITKLVLIGLQKSGYEYSFDGGDYDQLFNYFILPQILSRYGPPASVYIGTWTEGAILGGPYIPFSVVLYYPDMGFLIEYISPNKKVGQYLQGCPQRSYFQLTTVSPDQDVSLEKILSNASGEGMTPENIDYFKPLDEATGITIDEFYQKFKDPNNTECLETPIDLWGP